MTRLAGVLDAEQRTHLSQALAERLLSSVAAADLPAIVITSSDDVAVWARTHGAKICDDSGIGLSEAVGAGVLTVSGDPWLAIHADLPLVTPQAIARVAAAYDGTPVLVPSYDGGTTVIASRGPFPFSYGTGSFQRHFAAAPDAIITPSPELSVDIDTPGSLRPFLNLLDM